MDVDSQVQCKSVECGVLGLRVFGFGKHARDPTQRFGCRLSLERIGFVSEVTDC